MADLDSEEKETVRTGTACIIRSAEGLQIFLDKGPLEDEKGNFIWAPCLLEQSLPRQGKPSGYLLDECISVSTHSAVIDSDLLNARPAEVHGSGLVPYMMSRRPHM